MSMARDEIIKAYESAVFSSGLSAAAGNEQAARDYELLKAGLDALRGPTREQVEKVWRGQWVKCKHADYYVCNKCSTVSKTGEDEFCKSCGAPMTDEAVQMVMERLEALKDGGTTDLCRAGAA